MKVKNRLLTTGWAGAFCLALLVFQAGCENPSTTPDPGILYPPPNLVSFALTPGDGFIEVRFTMVATATNGYRIYWSASGNPSGAYMDVPQPETQLVYCKIEDLQNGQEYHVWAEARYPDGHSALSASISAAPRAKPQAPPAVFTAYPNDGALDLTWDPVVDADSYVVYWSESGGTEPPEGSESAEFYDAGSDYRDVMGHISGLSNGTPYKVWIQASNTSGGSLTYTAATGTPATGGGSPLAPGEPFLAPLDASLRVEWNAVKAATGYELYCHTSNESNSATKATTSPATITAGAGKMSAAITGLTNDTPYYVWVKALNGANASGFSPSNSETPKPRPSLTMANPSMRIGTAMALYPNAEAGKGDRLSRKQETALGDLVADSMLYWAIKHKGEADHPLADVTEDIDFAFVNGGVITGALEAGPIYVSSITRILYMEDHISILTMTGAQIKDLFHNYVAKVRHDGGGGRGTGAFGQVSKQVRYTIDYNYDSRGGVISGLTLNYVPFEDTKTYAFVTSTYLITVNDDGYVPILTKGISRIDTGIPIANAVCEWIYDTGDISPTTDGRITLKREVWQ
jgi:hypothetical protein